MGNYRRANNQIYKTMNKITENIYIAPEMEVVNIEIEESILLQGSQIEHLGDRSEDLEWERKEIDR